MAKKIEKLEVTQNAWTGLISDMVSKVNELVDAHNSSLTHSTGEVDNELQIDNSPLCGALIQATVEGPITCANPKGSCPIHESELKFCATCMQMTNHKNGVCQKCTKTAQMCGRIVTSANGKIDGHACFEYKPCPIHDSPSPREEWEKKISAESKQLLVDYSTSPKLEFYMNLRFKELFRNLLASALHSEKDRMRMGVENLPKDDDMWTGTKVRMEDVLSLIDNTNK